MRHETDAEFYRRDWEKQANRMIHAKGSVIPPWVCARLLPEMKAWAAERCAAMEREQIKENDETSRLHEGL